MPSSRRAFRIFCLLLRRFFLLSPGRRYFDFVFSYGHRQFLIKLCLLGFPLYRRFRRRRHRNWLLSHRSRRLDSTLFALSGDCRRIDRLFSFNGSHRLGQSHSRFRDLRHNGVCFDTCLYFRRLVDRRLNFLNRNFLRLGLSRNFARRLLRHLRFARRLARRGSLFHAGRFTRARSFLFRS